MLRKLLLYLSNQAWLRHFISRYPVFRNIAWRFVAGETIESAFGVVQSLRKQGIESALDYLGENVTDLSSARESTDFYLSLLDRMHSSGIGNYVSLKLTQLGLDIDEEICKRHLEEIVSKAEGYDIFVRIDMESSAYTQKTLDIFKDLYQRHKNLGVVIQSYLRRSYDDVQELVRMGARIRLCKGAYLEPPEVAYQDKKDVDRNYIILMEYLLTNGNYPAIATHDERIINHAKNFVQKNSIPVDNFEFQMLYGVRRDLQRALAAEGYRVRCYVPFGKEWYPYFMRRLAERPANVEFIVRSIIREAIS